MFRSITMDSRSKNILYAVIDCYIHKPFPVSSKNICKKFSFSISSATIRNTMADLEEMGYLNQPHVSAGRIPTNKGYRLYIEKMLNENIMCDDELLTNLYKNFIRVRGDLNEFLNWASKTISNHSNYIGIAFSSSVERSVLNKMELFSYKDDKIVALILTEEGVIKHKVIENKTDLSQKDLNRITSFLNSEFSGYTFGEIRERLIELYNEIEKKDVVISRALNLFSGILTTFNKDVDMFVSGMNKALSLPDFSSTQKIRELSRTLENRDSILSLLNKIIENEGVQVYIGDEFVPDTNYLSVVASRFFENERPFGVLGIIGPRRMDYSCAISIVETTARFLSEQLDII